MSKLNAFRKLIREEVRHVIREELRALLLEPSDTQKHNKITYKETIKESVNKAAPQVRVAERVSTDPIKDLLMETAMGMDSNTYKTLVGADSSMAQNFAQLRDSMFRPEQSVTTVGTVSDMLSSAQATSDITQVQIDTVPDFTGVMKALKEKGEL